jgi:hypothetical protein
MPSLRFDPATAIVCERLLAALGPGHDITATRDDAGYELRINFPDGSLTLRGEEVQARWRDAECPTTGPADVQGELAARDPVRQSQVVAQFLSGPTPTWTGFGVRRGRRRPASVTGERDGLLDQWPELARFVHDIRGVARALGLPDAEPQFDYRRHRDGTLALTLLIAPGGAER